MDKAQGSDAHLNASSRRHRANAHAARSPPSPERLATAKSSSALPTEYTVDLNLGFDGDSSVGSFGDLDMRLRDLQRRANSASALAEPPCASRTTSCSSDTLDTNTVPSSGANDDSCVCYGRSRAVARGAPSDWPIDLCRWAQGNPKPEVLYRKGTCPHSSQSPMFRLNRPAIVADLLEKHADATQPIGSFMEDHATSLEPFTQYVLTDAHLMPTTPQTALIDDHATQGLPPLASEEYAGHVSRLTYLMRSLQAVEAADPGFLSNTRVHLLLDLVMDLERAFTLPRVDFLRSHAETIQAMARHGSAPETRNTDLHVGDAQAEHIRYMTYAIPRHPRFRRANTDTSRGADTGAPSYTTHGTSILGSKLRAPSTGRSAPHDADRLATMPRSSVQPAAYVATVPTFDPKLHPVVGPQAMDISPTLHVANSGTLSATSTQGKSFGSQSLRRRARPGPELSPATSGGLSTRNE